MANRTPSIEAGGAMPLVKLIRSGQLTLPAEIRRELGLRDGDYFNVEVVGGEVRLKPVTVVDPAEADRQLEGILSQVKYVGTGPQPSDDELLEMVDDMIHEMRHENHAKGGAR